MRLEIRTIVEGDPALNLSIDGADEELIGSGSIANVEDVSAIG